MESFSQWFQDWAEACSYAQECVPDLPFALPRAQEPWSALGFIVALCWLLWRVNESRLARILAREAEFAGVRKDVSPASQPFSQIGAMFDAIKGLRLTASRKAAA
jgi:hypothetical protein